MPLTKDQLARFDELQKIVDEKTYVALTLTEKDEYQALKKSVKKEIKEGQKRLAKEIKESAQQSTPTDNKETDRAPDLEEQILDDISKCKTLKGLDEFNYDNPNLKEAIDLRRKELEKFYKPSAPRGAGGSEKLAGSSIDDSSDPEVASGMVVNGMRCFKTINGVKTPIAPTPYVRRPDPVAPKKEPKGPPKDEFGFEVKEVSPSAMFPKPKK